MAAASPSTAHGACPLDCPDGCSWVVDVRDGEAVGLRGRREHPYTHGALCGKVSRYLEHTRSPDRLLHPLRRVGAKGEGRFERVGWDEALAEVAERLLAVRDAWGGEAIWPYLGTGTLGYLQGLEGRCGARLWNVLGASLHHANICSTAGTEGLRLVNGTNIGMDPEDVAHAGLVLLWGTNPLTSHHHFWRHVTAARRRGAHVVAIDPIRTRSAAQCDEHLAPLPGTDAALALGLLHVVVVHGAHDEAFLSEHALGWDAYRERIEAWTPARAAAATGVEEATIVGLGERLARTRPTAIRATMGIQRHAGGGMALRTLATIPVVTGDWARPGGGLTYSTSGAFRGDVAALARDDLRPGPVRTLAMTRLADVLLEATDPPVKALVVYGANPVASNPDTARVREALRREDLFTVVLEQMATDTVDYADIVLPSTMQTEHLDVHDGYGHLYVALNEPAVAAPGECLPNTEVFRRLARRMGLQEPALYDTDEDLARQLLAPGDPALEGITLERLRRDGFARLGVGRPFRPFAAGVPTPSGRFELVSQRAAAAGHDPLPGFVAPQEAGAAAAADGDAEAPLALISPASPWFLNSTFANSDAHRAKAGGPVVELHPHDAAVRGLRDGEEVEVANERGAFRAVLRVTDAVRPGVAASPKGRWPKLTGGATVNATTAERDADLGRGAVFHDNAVVVRRVPANGAGPRRSRTLAPDLAGSEPRR